MWPTVLYYRLGKYSVSICRYTIGTTPEMRAAVGKCAIIRAQAAKGFGAVALLSGR